MKAFILGAGVPISGSKPSALKNISINKRAMDWQLHSLESLVPLNNVFFLGGYHIEEIVKRYPELNFIVMPEWSKSTPLDTFLSAPFSNESCVVTYGDTLFRDEFIKSFISKDADITVAVDSCWLERYKSRNKEDIDKAEVWVREGKVFEFTGLIYFSEHSVRVIEELKSESNNLSGKRLIDLIELMEVNGLTVSFKDVKADWAEFNSPSDIANFILGTKADTLSRLESMVKTSYIGEQYSFMIEDWIQNSNQVILNIQNKFGYKKLAVRSSSKLEDNWRSSNAGGFDSILNVDCSDSDELKSAIKSVVDSYGPSLEGRDQVLIQEFLQDVAIAGVVFTCTLESGAPYYRFNFDDTTSSTESVTSGAHSDLRTVLVYKSQPEAIETVAPELKGILKSVQELEKLLGFDKLDIEFAIDAKGNVHIFQVRPVIVNSDNYEIENDKIVESLNLNVTRYRELQSKPSFVSGNKTIFANMPDWNPAEIISTRPKPLSLSLYQQLITNEVWAKQRAEFGYKDVRPYPLIVTFSGHPYIDVRASFNSFIPDSVPKDSAERIVNAYVEILNDNPGFHDKVEFDVAFTIWTPEFHQEAKKRLLPYGVLESDLSTLEEGLKVITRNALTRLDDDIRSVEQLTVRRQQINDSSLTDIDKAFALLDDCKRYGTLAFSHAARAGFVAKTLLNSLVTRGELSDERCMMFLNSFDTVAGQFEKDKARFATGEITLGELIDKYGHLRPGTYEITTPAYWELPEQYLIPREVKVTDHESVDMAFSDEELFAISSLLEQLESEVSEQEFIHYLIKSTQERERVKFEMTKNLSKALDCIAKWAYGAGLSREDASFLTYSDIESLKLNRSDFQDLLATLQRRKSNYQVTKVIELPSVINDKSQFYCFERYASLPNYIGLKSVTADTATMMDDNTKLKGKIVIIPQADPGYDWLFGHEIAGLITQFGGANSHMAIRAAEIGLPAAIGVGEKLYEVLLASSRLELDCLGQRLKVVE